MPTRAAREGLRLTEAAALLDVSASTLRRYVKDGRLKASLVKSKYGTEYRILPAVLKVFAHDLFSINLSEGDLEGVKASKAPPEASSVDSPDVGTVALFERLLVLKDEAADYRAQAERYRALSEVSDSTRHESEVHYKAQIAELQSEIAELRSRRWFRRKG